MESIKAFMAALNTVDGDISLFTFWPCVAVGMILNWVRLAYKKDVSWNPLDYIFGTTTTASGISLAGNALAAYGVVALGMIDSAPLKTAIFLGVGVGFMGDAFLNLTQRQKFAKEKAKEDKAADAAQGGFVRLGLLPLLAATALATAPFLGGCAGGNPFVAKVETKRQAVAYSAYGIGQVYAEIGTLAATGKISQERKAIFIQRTDVSLLILQLTRNPADAAKAGALNIFTEILAAQNEIDAGTAMQLRNIINVLQAGGVPSKDNVAEWLLLGSNILAAVQTDLAKDEPPALQ